MAELYGSQRSTSRSGRGSTGRRGVSPIIATILLVAITVVLAAVLYVLISGLASHGSASAPLGSELALGPATSMTGSTTTPAWCASGHGCYSVTIASASTSLKLGEVAFAVKESTGSTHAVSGGTGQFDVVNSKGTVIANSTSIAAGQPLEVSSWTYAAGFSSSTMWSSQLTLCIEFGTGIPNPAGHGYVLEAYGVNGVQGVINYSLP
jgi:flagellin-like protein